MKLVKKHLAVFAAVLLVSCLCISPVLASTKTVSGTLAGYTCKVWVSARAPSSNSSVGETTYGTKAGVAVKTWTRCVRLGGTTHDEFKNASSNDAYSVSATCSVPADLVKIGYEIATGKADGTITNGKTWSDTTSWVNAS